MAEKNLDKDLKKEAKELEKAKKERIKQSKPKKEGTVFSRGTSAVKKFCKDFVGICKKVTWPTGQQVIKNAGVVIATIAVVAVAVFGVDWVLTEVFKLGKEGAINLGEQFAIETTAEETTAAETTAAAEQTTSEEETASEEETTAEGAVAEESTSEEASSEESTTAE